MLKKNKYRSVQLFFKLLNALRKGGRYNDFHSSHAVMLTVRGQRKNLRFCVAK